VDLIVVVLFIGLVFVVVFIVSVLVTRASGVGRLMKVNLDEIASGEFKPGLLLDTVVNLELVEFEGLDTPTTLVLTHEGVSLQASATPELLAEIGVGQVSLLPGDIGGVSGKRRTLGRHRVIGSVDDLPVRHLRIRAIAEAQ
jgi:hypothetical protein